MNQYLAPIAAVVLIALSIIPQAAWTQRFVPRETTAEQKAMADHLEELPMRFGNWVGEVQEMDETQREAAKIVGDFSVLYRNKLDPSQIVTIMVACGHGYDMCKHTPDQCFIASGFQMVGEEQRFPVDLPGGPAKFTTCHFRKDIPGQGPQNLRIFWSFNENGEWVSPTFRGQLTTSPAIYKIYATTIVASDTKDRANESVALPFLREFLPLIQRSLFPPAGSDAAAAGTEESPNGIPATTSPSDTTPQAEPVAPGEK
ncbi:MAG: exosortase-associated EpsI family protein [Pirellulales bacterium]|nr:exosortase-associated EpsI family protein [Pirellulales bacterium]